MSKKNFIIIIFLLFISTSLFSHERAQIIEDFEEGTVTLQSYPGQDLEPDDWCIDSTITHNNSQYSLKLYGNTWKVEQIDPIQLDTNSVWSVSAYMETKGEIHGFGILDSANVLMYSLDGHEELDIEEFITVYQGAFPEQAWDTYYLPVADDWFAWFEYYPTITSILFINDLDTDPTGIVYFDDILDVTEDLPFVPEVQISSSQGKEYRDKHGNRNLDVQFFSDVYDPDSDTLYYYWNFGDGDTSSVANPAHTYIIQDDHTYNVFLEVTDDTGMIGRANCQIIPDPGTSSFPITMNFVGDILLARGYENPGGIIQTYGVEAIFEPTIDLLGNAADVTIANLECPLTNQGTPHPTKPIYFRGDPENVDGLEYAGIDIVTLANNHILDYGIVGMQQTQDVVAQKHILSSGAGGDSYEAYTPILYTQNGVTFAFLASSDRTGQYNNYQPYLNAGFNKPGFAYMTPYYITQQIAEVEDVADYLIVEMHAGSEYSVAPGSNYDKSNIFDGWNPDDFNEDEDYTPRIDIPHMWDIEIRHHTIDAGADLVVCHHPHIIQGFEVYNGKLIAHSLGNFAFDLSYTETFPSMVLNAKINETGFYEYSVTPVYIDDWIPVPAQGELGVYILDYLTRRSKDLGTYLYVDRENVTADIILDTLNMEINTEIYEQDFQLEEDDGFWISNPMRLQKDGSISSINSITPANNWEYRLGREIIWFGNFEDEGCSLWNVNSSDEWYDSTEVYAGNRSLCHRRYPDSGDNIITNFEKRIKCYSATTDYSLQGYIKTQNAADVTVEIRYYYSRYGSYYLGSDDIGEWISGDSDWTLYHNELSLPTSTNFFDIRLNSNCPDAGVALSWFDNVGIIEWTEWQPINLPVNISNPNDYYFIQIKTDSEEEYALVTYTETNYGEGPHVSIEDNFVGKQNNGRLYQNYPNPFSPDKFGTTTISFNLATGLRYAMPRQAENAQIRIYNIKGQLIRSLECGESLSAKAPMYRDYSILWDGKDEKGKIVNSGIYFYQLKVGGKVIDTKKCMLLR